LSHELAEALYQIVNITLTLFWRVSFRKYYN